MARPLTSGEECSEASLSTSDYLKCLDSKGIKLLSNRIRTTPNQAMNRALMLIILLVFLHYAKIITLPVVGKYIPQMK